jgi:hypothetical protein
VQRGTIRTREDEVEVSVERSRPQPPLSLSRSVEPKCADSVRVEADLPSTAVSFWRTELRFMPAVDNDHDDCLLDRGSSNA